MHPLLKIQRPRSLYQVDQSRILPHCNFFQCTHDAIYVIYVQGVYHLSLKMYVYDAEAPSIPGVQVGNFLKKSVNNIRGENVKAREFRKELNSAMEKLAMDKSFLSRYVNDGFSGGEKKRLEMLQMMLLNPSLALLDETDSGLDIDALRLVASGVNEIAKDTGILVITHYQRLLDLVKPDFVHAMIDGKFVKSGGPELAHQLEKQGYDWLEA